MQNQKHQSGLTLIGFVFVLVIAGFFAYTAMKLFPAYQEYFGVVKAMKTVAGQPNAGEMGIEEARHGLALNFDLQYVDEKSIPATGIKIDNTSGARRLHIIYDKQIPFLYNIDFLLHFDHAEDLTHGA